MMLRIYSVSTAEVEAQAVFEREGFKISCTTILTRTPEIRVFNSDHKDVTETLMGSSAFIVATTENFLKVVAAIDRLVALPTDEPAEAR